MANLFELMKKLHDVEEDLLELSEEEFELTAGLAKEKVDNCVYVLEYFDSLIEKNKNLAAKFTEAKRILENKKDSLKDYMNNSLEKNKIPGIIGNDFKIKQYSKKTFVSQDIELTASNSLNLNMQYPGVVATKYAINKSKLKYFFDKNSEDNYLNSFCHYENRTYIKISAIKEKE